MTLTLYPYVYLLARAAFLNQSICAYEVGRTLGYRPWSCFLRISVPLARPAIAVGLSLVLMETLNDFGTVDYFAVPTLTVGVYDVWTNIEQHRRGGPTLLRPADFGGSSPGRRTLDSTRTTLSPNIGQIPFLNRPIFVPPVRRLGPSILPGAGLAWLCFTLRGPHRLCG